MNVHSFILCKLRRTSQILELSKKSTMILEAWQPHERSGNPMSGLTDPMSGVRSLTQLPKLLDGLTTPMSGLTDPMSGLRSLTQIPKLLNSLTSPMSGLTDPMSGLRSLTQLPNLLNKLTTHMSGLTNHLSGLRSITNPINYQRADTSFLEA